MTLPLSGIRDFMRDQMLARLRTVSSDSPEQRRSRACADGSELALAQGTTRILGAPVRRPTRALLCRGVTYLSFVGKHLWVGAADGTLTSLTAS